MQVSPFHLHWTLHPNIYVAPYLPNPIQINGDIGKQEWNDVPWSAPFDDIRGIEDAIPNERPGPECQTRIKIMWDHDFIYIAAMIESDMEVRATYLERNSPIFHQDSDFEVFIDPNSSCHDYKELEMNAIDTIWNLMLDKPYIDGGQEHSGRIAGPGDDHYYEVSGQKTAARLIEGSLNQAGYQRTVWAVEIALSHRDTMKHQHHALIPKEGHLWRINFSRVEKKGTLNWTWQKQRVWDPKLRKHCGKVDMHMPDSWGFIRFGPNMVMAKESDTLIGQVPQVDVLNGKGVDPLWPQRIAVMNVYYAQRRFNEENGEFAETIQDLFEYLDEGIMMPFMDKIEMITSDQLSSYIVFVTGFDKVLSVDNSRFMEITNRELSGIEGKVIEPVIE